MSNWLKKLSFDPLPPLASTQNPAIRFLALRDLADQEGGNVEELWRLPEPQRLIRRQLPNGAWHYPGGGKPQLRSIEDYNQLETFRILGELVEKYGVDKRHPAAEKAADYLFIRQTNEGDFRGIYGTQYTPNYSAGIMELLIKAGYAEDPRIENGFKWLLSMRQSDGGWAIPLRTASAKLNTGIFKKPPLQPNRAKPFSHMATGVVLRAFAAHLKYRESKPAKAAGELLASRFFLRDAYPDRQSPDFWLRFPFPFWFTDLLSALDSLSRMAFSADNPQISYALEWFAKHQEKDGTWMLKLLKTRDKDLYLWISLAICRVFKRFYD